MRRPAFLAFGILSFAVGAVGVVLPLLPTVPFMLLAAFCFARSSPRLERWLLEHEQFGPAIRNWRDSRSISGRAKRAAWFAFALSALIGVLTLPLWWNLLPLLAAAIGSLWIASVPTAVAKRRRNDEP